jgi:transposase
MIGVLTRTVSASIMVDARRTFETVQHGRITKRGSKLGRTCLMQCTLMAKLYSTYLNNYYERIKARKGGGKAIIATARKFLGII